MENQKHTETQTSVAVAGRVNQYMTTTPTAEPNRRPKAQSAASALKVAAQAFTPGLR